MAVFYGSKPKKIKTINLMLNSYYIPFVNTSPSLLIYFDFEQFGFSLVNAFEVKNVFLLFLLVLGLLFNCFALIFCGIIKAYVNSNSSRVFNYILNQLLFIVLFMAFWGFMGLAFFSFSAHYSYMSIFIFLWGKLYNPFA